MASRPVTAPVSPRPKTSSKGARSPRKKAQPKTPFELDQEAKQARLQKLRDAAKNARPTTDVFSVWSHRVELDAAIFRGFAVYAVYAVSSPGPTHPHTRPHGTFGVG